MTSAAAIYSLVIPSDMPKFTRISKVDEESDEILNSES